VTIGALALVPTGSQNRTLQDILGALGKNLVVAKSKGAGTVELGPLPDETF